MNESMRPKQGRTATRQAAAGLLSAQRWAALATVDDDGQPSASMVAYAVEERGEGVLLHLSRLAAHTGYLLARPQAALVISQGDDGLGDPQQLGRLSLGVTASVLERGSAAYAAARERYLARLADAAPLFEFPDFLLFRLQLNQARWVGGFANAHTLDAAELARGWQELQSGA